LINRFGRFAGSTVPVPWQFSLTRAGTPMLRKAANRSLDATKWNRGSRSAAQECLDCAALHRGYDRHDPLISRDQRIAGTTHAVASMQRSGIEGDGQRPKNASIALRCIEATIVTTDYAAASNASP